LQVTKIYFDNLSRTILAESMKSYLAAAIQMTSLPDMKKNLVQAEELIELAMRQGAELVTLPENFSFLGEEADKIAQAAAIAQSSEKFSKQWPKLPSHHSWWRFPVPVDNGKVYNTALLIDPSGQDSPATRKYNLTSTCPTAYLSRIQYGHGWDPTAAGLSLQ